MRYNYYNRKNKVGVVPVLAAAAATGPAAPMTALVGLAISALPGIIKFISNALQHPAKDARDVIASVKTQIQNQDARTRLASVIAGSKQNYKAADVDVAEMLQWYRQNYGNDYKSLLAEDMMYWNQYLDYYRTQFLLQRPDLQEILNRSYFSNSEINSAKQLSSPSDSTTTKKASTNILMTLGIVGAGLFLLLKKKNK
jgi:hypothetical protein